MTQPPRRRRLLLPAIHATSFLTAACITLYSLHAKPYVFCQARVLCSSQVCCQHHQQEPRDINKSSKHGSDQGANADQVGQSEARDLARGPAAAAGGWCTTCKAHRHPARHGPQCTDGEAQPGPVGAGPAWGAARADVDAGCTVRREQGTDMGQ